MLVPFMLTLVTAVIAPNGYATCGKASGAKQQHAANSLRANQFATAAAPFVLCL
jgi:hypothetical protein